VGRSPAWPANQYGEYDHERDQWRVGEECLKRLEDVDMIALG